MFKMPLDNLSIASGFKFPDKLFFSGINVRPYFANPSGWVLPENTGIVIIPSKVLKHSFFDIGGFTNVNPFVWLKNTIDSTKSGSDSFNIQSRKRSRIGVEWHKPSLGVMM
jgi:hypothetical protein